MGETRVFWLGEKELKAYPSKTHTGVMAGLDWVLDTDDVLAILQSSKSGVAFINQVIGILQLTK